MTRQKWLAVHRWLAVVIVVQLLASLGSALIFAVHSVLWHHEQAQKHPKPESQPPAYSLTDAITRSGMSESARGGQLWHSGSRPFYEITGAGGTVVLDGLSGEKMDFSNPESARASALAQSGVNAADIVLSEWVVEHNLSYNRGDLPAWRFTTSGSRHIYVSARTGKMTDNLDRLGRVSRFAYTYLHKMGYTGDGKIDAYIPIPYILAALSLCLLGVYLFISRYTSNG